MRDFDIRTRKKTPHAHTEKPHAYQHTRPKNNERE